MIGSVIILDIGIECLIADRPSSVRDLVLRVDQITSRKTGMRSKVCGVVGSLTLGAGALAEVGT